MSAAEVKEAEARRYRAMKDGDVAGLAEVLDDEMTYTHSNAQSDSKASYLEKVEAGVFHYDEIDISEETVVLHGDLAIVRGRMRAVVAVQGNQVRLNNLFLAVCRRTDGKWRLLEYQPTPANHEYKPANAD